MTDSRELDEQVARTMGWTYSDLRIKKPWRSPWGGFYASFPPFSWSGQECASMLEWAASRGLWPEVKKGERRWVVHLWTDNTVRMITGEAVTLSEAIARAIVAFGMREALAADGAGEGE